MNLSKKGAEAMRDKNKEFPLTIEDVRELMKRKKQKDQSKGIGIGIAVGVLAVLVAVIIWVAKRNCKDINEHYEYFDDEEDVEEFDSLDDTMYDDEEDNEQIEYVNLKEFIDDTQKEENEENTKA